MWVTGVCDNRQYMRFTRIYVAQKLASADIVELAPDAAAHLVKVLRAHEGDELVLFNGDGREFKGIIEKARGTRVSVAVSECVEIDRESPLGITLIQCVPRGDRMDFIVQKATELGVSRIIPVLSQRSVVRLDSAQAESKLAHWRAVAIGACEQCGRNRLPHIEAPRQLIHYLGEPTTCLSRLVCEPDSSSSSAEVSGAMVEIAVGPEGGFQPAELEAFRVSGFLRVRLGPRVLRAETAALAAITWLQSRFGDMSYR